MVPQVEIYKWQMTTKYEVTESVIKNLSNWFVQERNRVSLAVNSEHKSIVIIANVMFGFLLKVMLSNGYPK